MINEFAQGPELDEATSDLWTQGVKDFVDKGGFAALVGKQKSGEIQPLDLNLYLPTFAEIQKLNIKIEYIVEGAIPEASITTLPGPGGIKKTWLALQLGRDVSQGKPFVGLRTKKVPVYYIDYENSLPLLVERSKILEILEMKLWHISNPLPPPRLDSSEWILFKGLFPGLLIFDTLRSAQLLDENSSKDMALVMGRLKELRELGFTIILLHHTQKADSRTYKGSTAILDLCDSVLGLEKVREVGSDQAIDDDEEDLPFRLGTRQKTRYEPFHIFLKFDPSHGFYEAGDPDSGILQDMQGLLMDYQRTSGRQPNQTEFLQAVKGELNLNRKKFLRLLGKGEGQYWSKTAIRHPKTVLYCPLAFTGCEEVDSQSIENNGLSHCSEAKKDNGIADSDPPLSRCSPPYKGGTGNKGTTIPGDNEVTERDDSFREPGQEG